MTKGFTLIELLAVIVILAIIALIATPIVLNIINESRESSALRSAEFYLDAVEYTVADAFLNYGGLQNGTYPITPEGNLCKTELDINKSCTSENTLRVEVNGKKPNSGYIKIDSGNISNVFIILEEDVIVKNDEGELVYPEEKLDIEPKSFEEDSWETIAVNVILGNTSKYKVGDTKTITLDKFGTFEVRIANMLTPSECGTEGFSQTACGFVVEFTDIITFYHMNEKSTKGGWEASLMREYVNYDIFKSLPDELEKVIIDTKVVSGHEYGATANYITIDKLYLLATAEVWENDETYKIEKDTARDLTRQLDYYQKLGVTTKKYYSAIKGNENAWWLRSAYSSDYDFYTVCDDGGWDGDPASSEYGVSVAFRIG